LCILVAAVEASRLGSRWLYVSLGFTY
jgi:hypothetical protein